jgi:hypothetical protein
MSLVFGRKDTVSKSWSDLWDEEFEEEEEADTQLQALKEMNSRTWSHESTAAPSPAIDNDDTPRQGMSPATKSAVLVNDENKMPSMDEASLDQDLEADGLFFYEAPPAKDETHLPRQSPAARRNNMDKWAALGERRRAIAGSSPRKVPDVPLRTGRQVGHGLPASSPVKGYPSLSTFKYPNLGHCTGHHSPREHSPTHHQQAAKWSNRGSRERAKECPRNKARDRDWNWNFDWRKEKRTAFGYLGWVGNWQEARS